MNYTTSILIMAVVIAGGLYLNPVVGVALLIGAVFAVVCTWQHRNGRL
jgi:hypothetical protein